MTRAQMKERAKRSLGLNIFGSIWLIAVVICLVSNWITGVVGTVVPGLGAVIVVGPMTYGLTYVFLKNSRDQQQMDIGDLFKGFTGDFAGNLLIGLLSSIFIALWSLLFVIPGVVKAYAYSMAYYIKADHPEYDWRACLSTSQEMMRGHKMDLFILDLSFIGWYIVGALCLGIGTLFVEPYHQAARAQFYDSICAAPWIEG